MSGAEFKHPKKTSAHKQVFFIGTNQTVKQLIIGLDALLERVDPVGLLLARSLKKPSSHQEIAMPAHEFGQIYQGYLDEMIDLPKKLQSFQADEIWVSLPDVYWQKYRTLNSILDAQLIPWRKVEPLDQWLNGSMNLRQDQNCQSRNLIHYGSVDPVAILNRSPKPLARGSIDAIIQNKTVLITGAGGSIGSEIAWRASEFKPEKIILLERSENALFEIDRQLRQSGVDIQIKAILHDVTDVCGTSEIVLRENPAVIYHAAAHKHVPMMEEHPAAAVENNFYGTRAIADAAAACGVDRFVMISTDKAVNPTSVMGATKRLAEKYVQSLAGTSKTHFCMVRFGNVLGSACSVLPIWMKQLQSGGPLTVTHPEMTRYFMSIPEAAGLVLQASAFADTTCGGIFLLDMGEPILILDMAKRFLSLQGLKAGEDVDLLITGPRPGEKMHEELNYQAEKSIPTLHNSIRYLDDARDNLALWTENTIKQLDLLRNRVSEKYPWGHVTRDEVQALLHQLIPQMQPALTAGKIKDETSRYTKSVA